MGRPRVLLAVLAAVAAATPASAAAGLPSGRTEYRTAEDHARDLAALVAARPGVVRSLPLTPRSIEGRTLRALEVATDVRRRDDGRPTFAVVALQHAREWPAGEIALEWAADLAAGQAADPRVRSLLGRLRVVVLPVANPDGFAASRAAGTAPTDDDPVRTEGDALAQRGAYRRKNCRAAAGEQGLPCDRRSGVDLNRNAAAYWGGAGGSARPRDQDFRGRSPSSEPEHRALRRLLATRQVTGLVALHTYTPAGAVLRQPGFTALGGSVPEEARLGALGDAMAAAAGYRSLPAWRLGEITGALDDWAYFSLGAPSYTIELRGPNFHGGHARAVADEYPGVREALLRAAEAAASASGHAVLDGVAPPGATLRLQRAFTTPTSRVRDTDGDGRGDAPLLVRERVTSSLQVPSGGRFRWHVGPSTRPLARRAERWTLTCERRPGAVLGVRRVLAARGERTRVSVPCDRPQPAPAVRSGPVNVPVPSAR